MARPPPVAHHRPPAARRPPTNGASRATPSAQAPPPAPQRTAAGPAHEPPRPGEASAPPSGRAPRMRPRHALAPPSGLAQAGGPAPRCRHCASSAPGLEPLAPANGVPARFRLPDLAPPRLGFRGGPGRQRKYLCRGGRRPLLLHGCGGDRAADAGRRTAASAARPVGRETAAASFLPPPPLVGFGARSALHRLSPEGQRRSPPRPTAGQRPAASPEVPVDLLRTGCGRACSWPPVGVRSQNALSQSAGYGHHAPQHPLRAMPPTRRVPSRSPQRS
uniref:Proline-rich protein 2-like n=1 Tax=Callorhinus ursinus TaxID=34884 RepID=A0A3Q7NDS0_CALUR|nr:proline-rich protein 2-like [Callorhinus ursinus]